MNECLIFITAVKINYKYTLYFMQTFGPQCNVCFHETKIHYQDISILLIKPPAIHIYIQICELLRSSKEEGRSHLWKSL